MNPAFYNLLSRTNLRIPDPAAPGRGNKAARRAIATEMGREHIRWVGEDIYTDRPAILKRGHQLLIADSCKDPEVARMIRES
jgi:hypothetical protein